MNKLLSLVGTIKGERWRLKEVFILAILLMVAVPAPIPLPAPASTKVTGPRRYRDHETDPASPQHSHGGGCAYQQHHGG